MRVLASLSLLFALVGTSAFGGDPYPFQRSDGKWGYVDDDHCWMARASTSIVSRALFGNRRRTK